MAGLTAERLDPLSTPMLAIADQSVDLSIGVPEVPALLVGTSELFGVDADGELPADFSPRSRAAPALAMDQHLLRRWRKGNRPDNHVGCAA